MFYSSLLNFNSILLNITQFYSIFQKLRKSLFNTYIAGEENLMSTGRVTKWNEKGRKLPMNGFWHQTNVNDTCNTFNKATDGSVFHPEIQKNEILQIFNRDLCRSLPLQYKDTVNDVIVGRNDIEAFR